MPPTQNHYLKAFVGDEARMFMGVSCEAEGLWSKLRRIAHDRTPYGFLVDAYQRPLPEKHLADMCYLTNGRFEAILAELRKHGAILSIQEYAAVLCGRGVVAPRVKRRLDVYAEMCDEVGKPAAGEVEVLLVPPLVQQHIEFVVGQRTGRSGGGNPLLRVVNHPLNHPPEGEGLTTPLATPVNAQKSEVRSQKSEVREESKKERSSSAREKLPSVARFDYLLEQYRKFHDRPHVLEMQAAGVALYAIEFEQAIGYRPDEFEHLRARMAEMEEGKPRISAHVLRLPVERRRGGSRPARIDQLQLPFGGVIVVARVFREVSA